MPSYTLRTGFIPVLLTLLCLAALACSGTKELDSKNVTLLAHVNEYASTGYNDIWGYTAPDGREYALLGVKNGTSIIDITDTDNPVEIVFIASTHSQWQDIKTYQSYAYAVNESGGGVHIIDLSTLPDSATLVATYTGFSTSHNLFIDEGNAIMYAAGSASNPVRVLSLADPENPVEIATFGVECHDIYVQGNRAYISEGNQGSIGIYDVTSPSAPILLEQIHFPLAGYIHNAWLTEDGNYVMSTEETRGKTVKLWDIRDLGNISISDEYLGPNNLAHNGHIKGNYAYISHYESGLRIIDLSDPTDIFEAGFYGTRNAWGAFPFLPSGNILISDINDGLYIVKFKENGGS